MFRPMSMVALLVLSSCSDAAILRGGSSAFLSLDGSDRMRPDLVAKTLANVEEEWRKDAAIFTEGNGTAATEAPGSFAKSCGTVVRAVVDGSGGDRDVAKEYMNKVCGQKVLEGWYRARCTSLAASLTDHAMSHDSYANRQQLNAAKVCSGYWSIFVEAERNREAEEAAEEAKRREEEEKKRAEEEKKRAAEEAEAKKKAEAEAREEAERRSVEEARREKEAKEARAKKEAEDAKTRAAEAAKRLQEKKAEAEKVQQEAQQKLEEAAKAEKEHQQLLAEHQKAQERLAKHEQHLADINATVIDNTATNTSEVTPEVPKVDPQAVSNATEAIGNTTKIEDVATNATASAEEAAAK